MRWEVSHHYGVDGPFHASLLKLSDCWGLLIEVRDELDLSETITFYARREKLHRTSARHVTAEHMREYEKDVRWLCDKLPELSSLPEKSKHELTPYLELTQGQLEEAKRFSLFHNQATATIVEHFRFLYLGVGQGNSREDLKDLMESKARELRDACFERPLTFELVEAYFEATAAHSGFVDPSGPFLPKLKHLEAQLYSEVLLG